MAGYLWVQRRLGNSINILPVTKPTAAPLITPTPTRSIDDFLALAEQATQAGDLRTAITYLDQVSRRRPSDIALQVHATWLTAHTGQYAKAEQRARRILQNNPKQIAARVALCYALEYQRKYDEALLECQAAVTADAQNATALAYLSEIKADQGDCAGAGETARQAADLDPQNSAALHKLGYFYEVCGSGSGYNTALSYYQRALELTPNMPQILMDLGRLYITLYSADATYAANGQRAVQTFQQIVAADDQNAEAFSRLGVAYMLQGEYGKSAQAHEKALALEPMKAWMWTNRGWMHFRRFFYKEAIDDYQRAITTSQITSETLKPFDFLRLGFALQNEKRCAEALPAFTRAAELAPNDANILDNVNEGYRRCGK